MGFVKSILQQWRERNQKKDSFSELSESSLSAFPTEDEAEQHLLESLAGYVNGAVENGTAVTDLNVEDAYSRLTDAMERFRRESYNMARNELSDKWTEEETERIAEIKRLQEQITDLTEKCETVQKRYHSTERLRKTLSERIHQLEGELMDTRKAYERDIEEKLRQINKMKSQSLGLLSDEEIDAADMADDAQLEEEKVFDCDTVDDGNDTVIIKHRYASLYAKLKKAQTSLQKLRKENRNIAKRDLRHQQRIKILQETVQRQRKEMRQLAAELEQAQRKSEKKESPAGESPYRSPRVSKYPAGFATSFFDEELLLE